jgi:enoyl-CoA hydratase/carnithine racemase
VYDEILYDVADPVATITLNRPAALNAWTQTMELEVRDAVGRAVRDAAVVGIVLTGSGRGFCAGADLGTLRSITDGTIGESARPMGGAEVPLPGDESWGQDLRGTYTYLLSVPKPIVAAINGPVAGMGVPIVLCCDLRFMAEDAVLTTSFSERGLVAEWGISWLLPRLVGSAHALDLLFSARKITGREAAAMGVVNRAMPADAVLDAARAYVADLAGRCSPASMALMKRQVYQQLHAGLGDAEREAQALMVESFGRPDFLEGLTSFFEKRPPRFARIEEP